MTDKDNAHSLLAPMQTTKDREDKLHVCLAGAKISCFFVCLYSIVDYKCLNKRMT